MCCMVGTCIEDPHYLSSIGTCDIKFLGSRKTRVMQPSGSVDEGSIVP